MGNQVLAQMLGDLISRCSLITLMYQRQRRRALSHEEHAQIVKALGARTKTGRAAQCRAFAACGRKSDV